MQRAMFSVQAPSRNKKLDLHFVAFVHHEGYLLEMGKVPYYKSTIVVSDDVTGFSAIEATTLLNSLCVE